MQCIALDNELYILFMDRAVKHMKPDSLKSTRSDFQVFCTYNQGPILKLVQFLYCYLIMGQVFKSGQSETPPVVNYPPKI